MSLFDTQTHFNEGKKKTFMLTPQHFVFCTVLKLTHCVYSCGSHSMYLKFRNCYTSSRNITLPSSLL